MSIETETLICGLLIAFLASAALGAVLKKYVAFLPQATPTARSLHDKPIPRVAALMLWGGWLAGFGWIGVSGEVSLTGTMQRAMFFAFFGWAVVALVSFWDDCRSVPARWRLLAHGVAALAFVIGWIGLWAGMRLPVCGLALTYENISGFQAVLWWGYFAALLLSIVWMTNLFNFMDGSDG
ncbi:MAG: hypothetical protein LBB65_09010, partial [Burkholderiales bacterium]|nr:hypothetical protein [Burkholderiales bacterium]